jgi:acyl-coenzyme A synthetase/AMP-(fatty) acid ligase
VWRVRRCPASSCRWPVWCCRGTRHFRSATTGVPGIFPVIYDEKSEEVKAGSGKAGNVCIRNPWPGIMQTIWGDRERFVKQYYSKYCKNPKEQGLA